MVKGKIMTSRLMFLAGGTALLCGVHVGFCSKHETSLALARQYALEAEQKWVGVVQALGSEELSLENFQKYRRELGRYREQVRQCPRIGAAGAAELMDAEEIIEQAITYKVNKDKVNKDNGEKSAVDSEYLRSFIGVYGDEVDQIIQKALESEKPKPTPNE